jgi:hypothetical protein
MPGKTNYLVKQITWEFALFRFIMCIIRPFRPGFGQKKFFSPKNRTCRVVESIQLLRIAGRANRADFSA